MCIFVYKYFVCLFCFVTALTECECRHLLVNQTKPQRLKMQNFTYMGNPNRLIPLRKEHLNIISVMFMLYFAVAKYLNNIKKFP